MSDDLDHGEQPDNRRVTTFPTHASDGAFHDISESHSGPVNNLGIQVYEQSSRNAVSNKALGSPNPLALALSAVARNPKTAHSEVVLNYKDPNESYAPVFALGEERNLIIVTSRNEPPGKLFAIKRLASFPQVRKSQIRQVPHENIVAIREVLFHGAAVFIVYERMRISLADLIALPIGIEEDHIATICIEVLKGLQHMHDELKLQHGTITATSILFSEHGDIKIGNLDQALWRENHIHTASDIKALQTVVQPLRLAWSNNAHVFLRGMAKKSAHELLKSTFLTQSPGPRSLEPHVLFATVVANMPWRFCRTIVDKSA